MASGSSLEDATASVRGSLQGIAYAVFGALAGIELVISVLAWWQQGLDAEDMAAKVGAKIALLGLLTSLITSYDLWFPPIIEGFETAGVVATGGDTGESYTPMQLILSGISFLAAALEKIPDVPVIPDILTRTGITWLVSGLILFAAMVLVAIQFAVFKAEAYIAVNAGMILLGFAAFRGTAPLVDKYVAYVFNLGLRLFLIYLLIGLLQPLVSDWMSYVAASPPHQVPSPGWEVAGLALVYAIIAFKLPVRMASKVTSAFSPGISNALSRI